MRTSPPLSFWTAIANVATFCGALVTGGVLLVALGAQQTVAAAENRTLASLPALHWDAISDGSYAEGIEAYVADHFPARDHLLDLNVWLREHRGIRSEDEGYYNIEIAEGVLDESWESEPWESEPWESEPWESDQPADDPPQPWAPPSQRAAPSWEPPKVQAGGILPPSPPQASALPMAPPRSSSGLSRPADSHRPPQAPATQSPASPPRQTAAGKLQVRRGIFVLGGRAMQGFGGMARGSPRYAKTIKFYQDAVGDRVQIYAIMIPTAQAFYLPDKYRRRSKRSKPNIKATYARLPRAVKAVDAYSELEKHTDEYIYLNTDHHWTARGAYYAYRAFCKSAGLTPIALSAMTRKYKEKAFLGSLYGITRDSRLLKHRDHIEYFIPPGTVSLYRYGPNGDHHGGQKVPVFRERWSNYSLFLGGDAPLMVAKAAVHNHRRALMVKNSYGNAFAPFLMPHFEELVLVDYRKYKGRLIDLINEHQITDLIFFNGVHTANTRWHMRRVARLLWGKRGRPRRDEATPSARKAGPAAPAPPVP